MSNTSRRTSVTYPNGRVVNLGYGSSDSIDDLFSLVKSAAISGESGNKVDYTRVGLGRFVKISYPQPGVEMSMIPPGGESEGDSGDPYDGYDRFGRVQEMRWQSSSTGTPIDAWQWGYNEASNRTWKKNLVAASGQDESYGYDGLYQVIRDAVGTLNTNRTAIGGVPGEEEDFAYDPTGNWLGYRRDANGSMIINQTRSNNQDNQLTEIDGSSILLSYDRAGNATKTAPGTNGDWSKSYQPVWDAWNRLVEVKDETGASVQKNAYDGLSRRITKEASSVVTHTYWSDRWKPLEERIGSATTAARSYLWGERPGHRDELILRDRDTDGNGSLDERLYVTMDYFNGTAILNTSGTILERYAYSAFGVRWIMAADFTPRSTSSHAWDFGFQGQFRDNETGWSNYGYRFYVPLLGRWINRDPIGEDGSIVGLYTFSYNDSTNKFDRFGLWTCVPCDDQCQGCFPQPGDREECLADCRNAKLSMNCGGGGKPGGGRGGGKPLGGGGGGGHSPFSECFINCMAYHRADIAMGALGVSLLVAPLPVKPLFGKGVSKGGISGPIWTTIPSMMSFGGGRGMRLFGRAAAPLGAALAAGSAGYLEGLAISCAHICVFDPTLF
ncbi:MAG: RHS repeat-associated core domain-containing protein [Verrucomicrobiae bacterium]|nr:RHS repeat-associated core domain-containing protein [Verrucomicrobiae bacterium]